MPPTPSANSEIRHLNPTHVHKLGQILSVQDEWKELMGNIPSNSSSSGNRFTTDQINLIERESRNSGKSAFEILVDEWGTMGGKKRPKVNTLLKLCLEVDAIRAASYINEEILQRGPITDESGAARVRGELADDDSDDCFSTKENSTCCKVEEAFNYVQCDEQLEDLSDLVGERDNSDFLTMPVPPENAFEVPSVPFAYLRKITAQFGATDEVRRIGSGGFADVFLGITLRSGRHLAVKKLKEFGIDPARYDDQFNYEVGELSRLRHPYIIEILAYSNDSRGNACLVYPYYKNGNLECRLQCKLGEDALNVNQRMTLILGVAEAVEFLHTRHKKLIHRDIKSANVLLDDSLLPKLADFGLLRHASTNHTETAVIKGTPQYMAPEAVRGDVSVKIDVYSFGALLLEVLTGLRGMVDSNSDSRTDLITHVQEALDEVGDEEEAIVRLLDEKASWPREFGMSLFRIAQRCLQDKPKRPFIEAVRKELLELSKDRGNCI